MCIYLLIVKSLYVLIIVIVKNLFVGLKKILMENMGVIVCIFFIDVLG